MNFAAVGGALARRTRWVLDAVLPPQCPRCGAATERPGQLCGECFGAIEFITPPQCLCCGKPFPFAGGEALLCGACNAVHPPFRWARAAMQYN